VREGLVRKDDALAERVVGAVALADGDLRGGIGPLHQQREIEVGRLTFNHLLFTFEVYWATFSNARITITVLEEPGATNNHRRISC
jgi:hypothetical protein